MVLHSTVTNRVTREWLDNLPDAKRLSLVEPHKRFQNSTTLFQKRPDGFTEPIYTELP